jgi:hypothetical protein
MGGMPSRRHVSTAVTPAADRESLLRTRRGNRRAGRPGDDLAFAQSVRQLTSRSAKSTIDPDGLTLPPPPGPSRDSR